jgi:predicted RNA-binding Zn ribbon-like protein
MKFASYSDDPVALAVDLVNTYGWVSGTESLNTVADLRSFLAQKDSSWLPELPDPAEDDLESVRSLRASLHDAFATDDAEAAVEAINRILAASGAAPVLSAHGDRPHLHFEPATDTVGDWLAVVTAMGLATVIAEEGLDRLGVCAAHNCSDAFIDTSRNRSRRHCSDGCRSRENVAAFRRRQRDAD